MTDYTAALNECVTSAQEFNRITQRLKSMSDRIGADSSLSEQMAQAAQNTGRKELTTADFDNFKACIDLVGDMLNAQNGDKVSVTVNTGGDVKLGFYKMI